jgi:hypothetical protein
MALKVHEIHVLMSKIEGSSTEEIIVGIFVHRVDFIDVTRTIVGSYFDQSKLR